MEVYWKSEKLKLQFEDVDGLSKQYDKKTAKNIVKRMKEIQSFPSYADLPPNISKHSIKQGRKFLYFAVDVPSQGGGRGKMRLIFEPYGEFDLSRQNTIRSVKILGIINYHRG